jgi:hypothetical protein
MKGQVGKAKDHVKKNTKAAKTGTPAKSLDPCTKPQAQESASLESKDEACNDGVK